MQVAVVESVRKMLQTGAAMCCVADNLEKRRWRWGRAKKKGGPRGGMVRVEIKPDSRKNIPIHQFSPI
jgi:hypothetical protein